MKKLVFLFKKNWPAVNQTIIIQKGLYILKGSCDMCSAAIISSIITASNLKIENYSDHHGVQKKKLFSILFLFFS